MSDQVNPPVPAKRVFLVHNAPLALLAMERMLARAPGLEAVGRARHGAEALPLLEKLRPDVVCLQPEMPVMDGLELTRAIMSRFPTPILVLEMAESRGEEAIVDAILKAGALDHFELPADAVTQEQVRNDFTAKVRRLARVPVISRQSRPAYVAAAELRKNEAAPAETTEPEGLVIGSAGIVAMGASTGGPQVLLAILSQLPANYPRAILCVQHISKGFLAGLVDWLDSQCSLRVKIAHAGEMPRAGYVYFPAEDNHMELDARGRIRFTEAAPVGGHRPSVTTMFESVARRCGANATGVLLTGMGTDGALGLVAMARAGALTIAQDEATSVVFGMPRQAIALSAAKLVLPPQDIVRKLLTI